MPLSLAQAVRGLAPESRRYELRLKTAAGKVGVQEIGEKDALPFLIDYLKFRAARKFDGIVVITGDEGVGKSTLGLRLCQGLNPAFDLGDLAYTASEVLGFYERARRGQPFMYDEGVRGLLGGETFSPDQVALVKAFTLVRECGAILIICIPSIHMLAKQVRSRRATLWIHVTERGHARVFVRDHRLKFKDKGELNMTEWLKVPRVSWSPFRSNSRLFLAYLARKRAALAAFLAETKKGLGPAGETRAQRKTRLARDRQRRHREKENEPDPELKPEEP